MIFKSARAVVPFCPYFKHANVITGIEDIQINMTEVWLSTDVPLFLFAV